MMVDMDDLKYYVSKLNTLSFGIIPTFNIFNNTMRLYVHEHDEWTSSLYML